jgi:hypothetical protein
LTTDHRLPRFPPYPYAKSRELLVKILQKDGRDASASVVDQAIEDLDGAWRLEDRAVSYELCQRSTPKGREFRKAWAEQTQHAHFVMEEFEKSRRKFGVPKAAMKAAQAWDRPLRLQERKRPADRRQKGKRIVWDTRIGSALIRALEDVLKRPLRFSAAGGPDVRLLVDLCSVIMKEMCDQDRFEKRGIGKRKFGSATWFVSLIRQSRKTRGSVAEIIVDASRFARQPGEARQRDLVVTLLDTASVPDCAEGWCDILCTQEDRQVARDNTVLWRGRFLQIPSGSVRPRATVQVLEYLGGTFAIFDGPDCLARYRGDGSLLNDSAPRDASHTPPSTK